jgi:hypothetical protein
VSHKSHHKREDGRHTNPLSATAKVVLGIGGGLLGFFSHALGGWGLPSAIAAAAVVVPTLKYRRYWRGTWFWMTILAMAVLQAPLVITTRPLMDRYGFGFNIVLATIDGILVVIAVNWVRPEESDDE